MHCLFVLLKDTDASFRQFADDFQAFGCRSSNVSRISCYALNLIDPTILALNATLVSDHWYYKANLIINTINAILYISAQN